MEGRYLNLLKNFSLSTSAARIAGRAVLKRVKVKAVDTGRVPVGGDGNGVRQEKTGGTQSEGIPLHAMEKVPCQEAARLLHTICISEEIKCASVCLENFHILSKTKD